MKSKVKVTKGVKEKSKRSQQLMSWNLNIEGEGNYTRLGYTVRVVMGHQPPTTVQSAESTLNSQHSIQSVNWQKYWLKKSHFADQIDVQNSKQSY